MMAFCPASRRSRARTFDMPGGRTLPNNKTQDEAKPLIVLDGANIACAYKDTRPPGDATGIVQAFEHYDNLGHNVLCFVKQYRIRNERNPKAVMENIELFNERIPKQSIATVPGKSDDDSFFIDYCMKNGAVLITNDGLRDHEERFEGDEKATFLKWRNTSKCGFMFAAGSYLEEPGFKMPNAPKDKPQPIVKDTEIKKPISKQKNKSKKSTNQKTNSQGRKRNQKTKLNHNELRQLVGSIILDEMEEGILVGEIGNRMPKWYNKKMGTSFKTVTEIKKHIGYGKNKTLISIIEEILGEKIRIQGESSMKKLFRVTNSENKKEFEFNEAIGIILRIIGWELKPSNPFWASGKSYSMKYAEIGERFKRETGQSIKSVFPKVGDLVSAIRTMNHPSMVKSFDCQFNQDTHSLTIREIFSPFKRFGFKS